MLIIRSWLVSGCLLASGWLADLAMAECTVSPPLPLEPRRMVELFEWDSGGRAVVMPLGHPNGQQPDDALILDRGGWRLEQGVLPWQQDRHGCVSVDLNDDQFPDLYCVAGGGRGAGTGNPNRAYLGRSDGSFSVADVQPAPDLASLRSRRVYALTTPLPDEQRLLLTVWGTRQDDRLNDTLVVTLHADRLDIEQVLPGRPGGRCAATADLNQDGFDDMAVCHERGGASLWLSGPDGQYQAQTLATNRWITDIQFGAGLEGNGPPLYLLGLDRLDRIGFSCTSDGCVATETVTRVLDSGDNGRARSLVIGDFAASPHEDVFIIRSAHGDAEGDRDDVLLPGPHLNEFWPVPAAGSGMGFQGLAIDGGILRGSGGPDWPGTLDFVRCEKSAATDGG